MQKKKYKNVINLVLSVSIETSLGDRSSSIIGPIQINKATWITWLNRLTLKKSQKKISQSTHY